MKRTNKYANNNKLTSKSSLAMKLLVAITSGLAFLPGISWADEITQNIETTNGTTYNNSVNDIYAQRIVGNTIDNNHIGVNEFKKFDVGSSHVVNMHFKQGNENGQNVGKLVNLVESKINIAGAVNAIKDNKVGGDLYFLSKDGMAVTSSGVINAGSLTVLTPAKMPTSDGEIRKVAYEANTIALNPKGEISIDGHINITGEEISEVEDNENGTKKLVKNAGKVRLRAGKSINIGSTAKITTGIEKEAFGAVVSLNNEQKQGTRRELVASVNGDGDIVLDVLSEGGDEHTANIAIKNGATVKAKGHVEIKAAAKVEDDVSAESSANVKIAGKIEAGKSVNISAQSESNVSDADVEDLLNAVFKGKEVLDLLGVETGESGVGITLADIKNKG